MKIDYVSDLHINHWIPWDNDQIKWERRTREIIRRLISNWQKKKKTCCSLIIILQSTVAGKQGIGTYGAFGDRDTY